jgi:hypothetical protein
MSEPVTSEKFAVGQSVRHLKEPRFLQALGAYSGDVKGAAVRMRLPVIFTRRTGRGASPYPNPYIQTPTPLVGDDHARSITGET